MKAKINVMILNIHKTQLRRAMTTLIDLEIVMKAIFRDKKN